MGKVLTSLVILLQLGGGFMGLANIVNSYIYANSMNTPILTASLGLILYSFGISAGFALIHKAKCARLLSIIYQSLQIPYFNTGLLYYGFYSGVVGSIIFEGENVGTFFQIGSGIDVVLQPDLHFCLGVNVVALALVAALIRSKMSE